MQNSWQKPSPPVELAIAATGRSIAAIAAIAAIAIAAINRFGVATRDVSPFQAAKVNVINPWGQQSQE